MAWNEDVAGRRRARRSERRKTGLCVECGLPAGGYYACEPCRKKRVDYEQSNKEKFKQLRKNFCERMKRQAIDHYGGRCACCSETEIAFLSIDHVDDNGNEHRQKLNRRGSNFYHWLVKNRFPDDYNLQVLCFNCNMGRRVAGGVCPHQLSKVPHVRAR